MVGQIQDEFDYLRSQIESLQLQVTEREANHGNSLPGGSNGGMVASEMAHIPDLNAPVEPSEDIESLEMTVGKI
jgi:hypothetical protein